MRPIAYIETPFWEKFGVPRQSLLISEAWGRMRFPKTDFYTEAFRGLELSSHLWLIFEFHQIPDGPYSALIRPPRYENKVKMGVYATRSPHRPNRIGLSLVEFDRLEVNDKEITLFVRGVDLVNETPVLDIKPYVPYADAISVRSPFHEAPELKKVVWRCNEVSEKALIEKVIALDPRPAHEKDQEGEFGVTLAGYNVRFKALLTHFEIISATRLK